MNYCDRCDRRSLIAAKFAIWVLLRTAASAALRSSRNPKAFSGSIARSVGSQGEDLVGIAVAGKSSEGIRCMELYGLYDGL